jgi:hypothetical protein
MTSFDDYLYGLGPTDNEPLGPLETWRKHGFTVVGKNGRIVMKLAEDDYSGLVIARDVLAAIMNDQLTPEEIEHLKKIVDVMIQATW